MRYFEYRGMLYRITDEIGILEYYSCVYKKWHFDAVWYGNPEVNMTEITEEDAFIWIMENE